MVIDKLDTLETSLKRLVEELTELRSTRKKMESRVEEAQHAARSAADALSGRDGEISRLRQENERLSKERVEVRGRVERILHRFPDE